MNMCDCPKFEKCSAPICPLNNQESVHLPGEPICFYLRECVKQGGFARISAYIPKEMAKIISSSLPGILSRHVDIKNRLSRAAGSGSKLETFKQKSREAA
jgi:hypothetical protein